MIHSPRWLQAASGSSQKPPCLPGPFSVNFNFTSNCQFPSSVPVCLATNIWAKCGILLHTRYYNNETQSNIGSTGCQTMPIGFVDILCILTHFWNSTVTFWRTCSNWNWTDKILFEVVLSGKEILPTWTQTHSRINKDVNTPINHHINQLANIYWEIILVKLLSSETLKLWRHAALDIDQINWLSKVYIKKWK